METNQTSAPPVVAVMVVTASAPSFDETLVAIAAQDYPNLRWLMLICEPDEHRSAQLEEQILASIDDVVVHRSTERRSFGRAVNEVLGLVEGDNGFFLICHDDIAPDRDAVRQMVAELYRANAGIVGPKFVEFDDPQRLHDLGSQMDRAGELVPVVELGEIDQGQYDDLFGSPDDAYQERQRDGHEEVFVVSTACMLIRADLFRTLGGFDPGIDFHGEDRDLCWRAQLGGARVVVASAARVRHEENLAIRRPDLNHRQLRDRNRIRTVAALSGTGSAVGVLLALSLRSLMELVVGLFTGRLGDAGSGARAVLGAWLRIGSIAARRRTAARLRMVDEAAITARLLPGNARVRNFLRGRETTTYLGVDSTVRRWRPTSAAPLLAWSLVAVLILIGSRSLIDRGVPQIGEFLVFPESPRQLFAAYLTGWDPRATGVTAAVPSGWLTLVGLSVFTGFRMGLAMTVSIIAMMLIGAAGAWRLASVFPLTRARISAMVVYIATPLVPGLVATGRWSSLLFFAALPWAIFFLCRAAGIGTADPSLAEVDLVDAVAPQTRREQIRYTALAALTIGIAASFEPVIAVLWVIVGIVLAATSLLARSKTEIAGWFFGGSILTALIAGVLSLPWSLGWSWAAIVPMAPAGPSGRGLVDVLSLAVDQRSFVVLSLALYVTAFAALALSRAWRLTWAIRAAGLIAVFGGWAVLAERNAVPFASPDPGLLFVPIALGLALSAAAVAGGFGEDVLRRGFGWRQPLGLLGTAAIVIGIIPALISIGNGAWGAPRTTIPQVLEAQLPAADEVGDYRVLIIGDPRAVPVPSIPVADGIGYAVVDSFPLDFTDRFAPPDTTLAPLIVEVIDAIADGSTRRAGELLAPFGIRYVVVPEIPDRPGVPIDADVVPTGLAEQLSKQLDLAGTFGAPNARVFANTAWLPTATFAGDDQSIRAAFVGATAEQPTRDVLGPGVFSYATGFDDRWRLRVDGQPDDAVVAIDGPTLGYRLDVADVTDAAGGVEVEFAYRSSPLRPLVVVLQLLLWLAVVLAATRFTPKVNRRVEAEAVVGPVLGFEGSIDPAAAAVMVEPELETDLDPWGTSS